MIESIHTLTSLDKEHRLRLALHVTKDQGLRLDAVSEILNVLRMRYTLSERVHFHHAKNIASAMLGEALSHLTFGAEAFDYMRDEELLPWIRKQASDTGIGTEEREAVVRLVDRLEARRLHKTIYRVGLAQQDSYQIEHAHHLGEDFSAPAARRALQDEIRSSFPQLREGDVIVYCPQPRMRMKEVWANGLARKDDTICRPLRQEEHPYLPEVVLHEVESLEEKYKALWSWNLFLAPDKLNYSFAVQTLIDPGKAEGPKRSISTGDT